MRHLPALTCATPSEVGATPCGGSEVATRLRTCSASWGPYLGALRSTGTALWCGDPCRGKVQGC